MRRARLRLHAPFIALALAQAGFVAWAPSRDEQPRPNQAAPAAATTAPVPDAAIVDASTGADVTTKASIATAAASDAPVAATATGAAAVAGDTSHCRAGWQTDVVSVAPPCAPRFVGDNGGATYPGVTPEEIRVVEFECRTDEQVGALLATQGLVSTPEERDAMLDAGARFVTDFYETYGRTVVIERVVGDCPTTPPDPARARAAAAEVARTHPALVLVFGGDAAAADTFAQAGITAVGVVGHGAELYAGRRPFRWDLFPTSTDVAAWVGEYWCKKLAGGPASNAGRVIHPSIGGRGTTRAPGIVVPDDGTGAVVPAAQALARLLEGCGEVDVPIFTYESDINRATEQTRAVVAGLIDAGVTTVACMCDSIAPVFLTKGMTQNGYYPEHLVTGMGLIDHDSLARLYDPAQWAHAFGISQIAEPVPHAQTDAAKIWRAVGNEGSPCTACTIMADYVLLLGSMIQLAGPHLDPGTIEQALVGASYRRGGWAQTGGDPHVPLLRFGPGDYNAMSDFREVRWDPRAASAMDGRPGAYVSLHGGRRYASGELTPDFDVEPTAG